MELLIAVSVMTVANAIMLAINVKLVTEGMKNLLQTRLK